MVDYNKPWGWSDQEEEKRKQNNNIRPITASEEQAPGPLMIPHKPTMGEQMTRQVGTAVAKEGIDSIFSETGKQAATGAMTQGGATAAGAAADTAANASSAAPVVGPLAGAAVNVAQGKYGTAAGSAAGGVVGGMVAGPIGAMIGSKVFGMLGGAIAGDNKGAPVVTPTPTSGASEAATVATEDLLKDNALDVWSEFAGFADGTDEVRNPNIRRNGLLNVGRADADIDKIMPGWQDKWSPEAMTERTFGSWTYDYAPSTLTNYYLGFADGTTGVPTGGKGAANTNPGESPGMFRAHAPGVTASKPMMAAPGDPSGASGFGGSAPMGGKGGFGGSAPTTQSRGLPNYATNYYNPAPVSYSPVQAAQAQQPVSQPAAPTPVAPAPAAPAPLAAPNQPKFYDAYNINAQTMHDAGMSEAWRDWDRGGGN